MTRSQVKTICALLAVAFLALWFVPQFRSLGFAPADCVLGLCAVGCCAMLVSVEDWPRS